MISKPLLLLALVCGFAFMTDADAQVKEANYDEAKVGNHPLPDPLKFEDGQPVRSASEWRGRLRGARR